MSLKLAHTVFVVLAALFCAATAVWTLEHADESGARYLFAGIGCAIVFCALVLHGYRFVAITKDTNWL